MSVRLVGKKRMNWVASHHVETHRAVRKETREVRNRARIGLSTARATTQWSKIIGPSHLTKVGEAESDVDGYVFLEAPNAMAIEFGHMPSGVFGPGGRFEHVVTKAPEGLYILHKAARII